MKLSYFGNDRYILLKYLVDHVKKQEGQLFYIGNQQEIANHIHFAKQKTNFMMQDLQNDGFIELIDKYHSVYKIKDKAIATIKAMEKEI